MGDFPSVNTILSATMPPEKKQALAAWAIKSKEKWHRDHRKCKNCQHFQNEKCAIGKKGDRIQTPWKKNRCGGFEMLPLLANSYDPRTEALSRGTKIHDQIEKVLRGEPWPSAEDFPQGKQTKGRRKETTQIEGKGLGTPTHEIRFWSRNNPGGKKKKATKSSYLIY